MPASHPTQDNPFNETVATFGDRLAAAREAKGLTVQGLAEKIGVETSTIEAWEADHDAPLARRLQLVAGLLNVSIVWMITGEGNGSTNIADTYERPVAINDALGEITQLKATLVGALEKLERLEQRLIDAD